jgi:hypothetical protein
MNCGRNCACQSLKKRNKLAVLYTKVAIDQLKNHHFKMVLSLGGSEHRLFLAFAAFRHF